MAKQVSTATTHLCRGSIGVMFMSCRINCFFAILDIGLTTPASLLRVLLWLNRHAGS